MDKNVFSKAASSVAASNLDFYASAPPGPKSPQAGYPQPEASRQNSKASHVGADNGDVKVKAPKTRSYAQGRQEDGSPKFRSFSSMVSLFDAGVDMKRRVSQQARGSIRDKVMAKRSCVPQDKPGEKRSSMIPSRIGSKAPSRMGSKQVTAEGFFKAPSRMGSKQVEAGALLDPGSVCHQKNLILQKLDAFARQHTPPAKFGSGSSSSDSEGEDDDDHAHCGLLLDMIKRKSHITGGDSFKLVAMLAEGEAGIFEYTRATVLRDEFLAMVWDVICSFYKDPVAIRESAGPTGKVWPKTTSVDIRSIVKGIVAYKREVVCFKTEVYNWILKSKLLKAVVPAASETLYERFNRMEEFWAHYHKRLRRNELPPMVLKKSSMAATTSGWRSSPLSPKSAKKPMCFAGDDQWSMIEQIEQQSKPDRRHRSHTPIEGLARSHQRPSAKFAEDVERPTGDDSLFLLPTIERQGSKALERLGSKSKTTAGFFSTAGSKSQTTAGFFSTAAAPALGLKAASPLLRRCSSEPNSSFYGSPASPSSSSSPKKLPSLGKKDSSLGSGPTSSYLEACQRCWIVPMPLPFVTGHSWKLQAAGREMMDNDLMAVAPVLQEVDSIEEVDLSGNALLTEKALVPFLERLYGDPAANTLKRLILKGVKHIGIQSMTVISSLVSAHDGLRCLKHLNLAHVHITPKCHLKLAKSFSDHKAIVTIDLSDTGLGSNSWIAKQCVSLLMADSVRHLSIGWNCFDAEVFKHLGESLVTRNIQSISVSNCSSACLNLAVPSPIQYFLECLARDKSLTYIDVSLNRMDFREMLIIEDALALHKKINKLDISNNPMGILGMRSALRLLVQSSNSLVHLESSACYSGSALSISGSRAQTFNMCNPGGKYALDLSRPYHRAILRMLYTLVAKYKTLAENAFLDLKYSKSGWTHAQAGADGRFEVPEEGRLNFCFNIDDTIEKSIQGLDPDDFGGFVDKHRKFTKITPPWNKVIPLFACWKSLDGNSMDQSAFLQAMSKDFCLTPSHLEHMATSCPSMRCEIIDRLLPCVTGGEASESLVMMLFQSLGEFARMHKRMRSFIDFNVENATGHYKLDLASCTDYCVAEKLLLLDRWEVVMGRSSGRKDTSQRGNYSHIRNEHHNHQPLHLSMSTIAEWTLPEADCFECDYVTGRRCPRDAVIMNEAHFNHILVCVYDAECSFAGKIEVLRLVSHHIYMTAKQMRELLGCFKLQEQRAEVFVSFFLRVKDMWNAKVFSVRFTDKKEIRRLMDRLGYATVFPFIQPENGQFELDHHFYDQKLCANILLQLAAKEGTHNVKEPSHVYPDGSREPFLAGVPRSWDALEKMPKEGVFKGLYICAPENRKFATRTMLAETYGFFPMDIEEKDVLWWTGLTEVGEDVLELLEFCIGRFKTMDEAFTAIDGEDGNGLISLREFEDGIKALECKKFAGKDEQQRINALFRVLDPSCEGTVSREEWGILEQLYREFDLCIQEFVQFLERMFGNDLADAWNFLDDDDSGELSLEEWMGAVEGIGYFGPAKCVFSLIDNSDDGSISFTEFVVLERYLSHSADDPEGEAFQRGRDSVTSL